MATRIEVTREGDVSIIVEDKVKDQTWTYPTTENPVGEYHVDEFDEPSSPTEGFGADAEDFDALHDACKDAEEHWTPFKEEPRVQWRVVDGALYSRVVPGPIYNGFESTKEEFEEASRLGVEMVKQRKANADDSGGIDEASRLMGLAGLKWHMTFWDNGPGAIEAVVRWAKQTINAQVTSWPSALNMQGITKPLRDPVRAGWSTKLMWVNRLGFTGSMSGDTIFIEVAVDQVHFELQRLNDLIRERGWDARSDPNHLGCDLAEARVADETPGVGLKAMITWDMSQAVPRLEIDPRPEIGDVFKTVAKTSDREVMSGTSGSWCEGCGVERARCDCPDLLPHTIPGKELLDAVAKSTREAIEVNENRAVAQRAIGGLDEATRIMNLSGLKWDPEFWDQPISIIEGTLKWATDTIEGRPRSWLSLAVKGVRSPRVMHRPDNMNGRTWWLLKLGFDASNEEDELIVIKVEPGEAHAEYLRLIELIEWRGWDTAKVESKISTFSATLTWYPIKDVS